MANETGYKSRKVLLYKETTEGVIPATIATGYQIGTITQNFDRVQRTETNILLSDGANPSKTDTGGEDPAGSIELKCTPDWDVLKAQCVLGLYTTKTTLNDAHATSTAYAADDVVVLGGTDVLVCKTGGTSDADDTALLAWAALSTTKTGDTYTDGTVVWVITLDKTAMYQYDGVMSEDLMNAGIIFDDYTAQGGGVAHKTYGRGAKITNMSIGKEQGGVIAKNSHNIVAHGALSDTQDGFVAPTVTAEVVLADTPFKRDDICVTFDGVAPDQVESIVVDIDRAITMDDGAKCFTVQGVQVSEKITTIGTPTVSGTISARFTKERFEQAFKNKEQSTVITYKRPTGESAVYTMANTQILDSTKTYDTTKPIVLSIPINVYGTDAVTYSIRSFLDFTK